MDNYDLQRKEFSEELNEYLISRFNYKSHLINCNRTVTISSISRVKFKMHLRFKINFFGELNTLVIASLQFKNTQEGNGTHLLNFFLASANKYGFENIGLESTNDKSNSFGRSLGFKVIDNRNQIISIKQLKKNLDKKLLS